jgi:hypothetical protein
VSGFFQRHTLAQSNEAFLKKKKELVKNQQCGKTRVLKKTTFHIVAGEVRDAGPFSCFFFFSMAVCASCGVAFGQTESGYPKN